MHLEVEVRVDPVRVARVADEPDRLPGLDARAALQALCERDPDLAAATVVVPVREVVVQVDVVVGRPALAVEVEHAAGPARAGVEPDATRLGRQRERVPGREDVDALVRPLRPGRAVVVAEVDRAQHGEHDLARMLRLRGLRERRVQAGVDRDRRGGPYGDAEEGQQKKCSGCRPDAHQKGPVALEGQDPSRCLRRLRTSGPWLESLLEMKIAVCVKEVPDAAVTKRIDPSTKRLDRSGEGVLNHFDSQAVEEALKVKEAGGESEVVLVSMGPAGALDSLRKALAMGADRAVLVSDDAAVGSDLVATSRALAAALEREGADLVLFGQQSSDSDGAVLWAAVADRLRRPVISQVAELTVSDGKVRGKRQTEFGYDVIEAPLPVVIAVSDAINEPRYPSLKGIMSAKKKPQESLSGSDLGLDADALGEQGSGTSVLALGDPPPRADARKIEDDGSAAGQIADFLAEKKLL